MTCYTLSTAPEAEDAVAADGEPAKDEGLSRIMRAAGAPR